MSVSGRRVVYGLNPQTGSWEGGIGPLSSGGGGESSTQLGTVLSPRNVNSVIQRDDSNQNLSGGNLPGQVPREQESSTQLGEADSATLGRTLGTIVGAALDQSGGQLEELTDTRTVYLGDYTVSSGGRVRGDEEPQNQATGSAEVVERVNQIRDQQINSSTASSERDEPICCPCVVQ